MSEDRIDVLFVCTHNAGRSVAAKTMFNDRASKLGLDLASRIRGNRAGGNDQPCRSTHPRIIQNRHLPGSAEAIDRRSLGEQTTNRDDGLRSGRRVLPVRELLGYRRLGVA